MKKFLAWVVFIGLITALVGGIGIVLPLAMGLPWWTPIVVLGSVGILVLAANAIGWAWEIIETSE